MFINILKITVQLKPADLKVKFADGRQAKVRETVDLIMTFNGKTIKANFRVLPRLDVDLLFGIDILTAVNYAFDFSSVAHVEEVENQDEINAALHVISEEMKLFENITKPTTAGEHVIRLKPNAEPVNVHYTPRNPAMLEIMQKQADEMIAADVIEPSKGEWCSPIVLTKRKNKTYRFCNDFRKVNTVSIRELYPIPHINATLD